MSDGVDVGQDEHDRTKPDSKGGACIGVEAVPVPRELEQTLRDEVDISCCLGCDTAGPSDGRVKESGVRDAGGIDREAGDSTAGVVTER